MTISNPNNYAIHVDSVSTAFAQALGCSAADFTITPPTGGTPTVPANGSITWAGGSLAMNETNVNQDGCKPSGTPTNTGTITYTVH